MIRRDLDCFAGHYDINDVGHFMVHVQILVLSLGLMGLNPHKFTHIVANHSREALVDRAYAYEILLDLFHF